MIQSGVPVASSVLRALAPPRWVDDGPTGGVNGSGTGEETWSGVGGTQPTVNQVGEFAYTSARIPRATALDALQLESEVGRLYDEIASTVAGLRASFPLRFWNYIPGIHATMGPELSRYMVFNSGRFRAMTRWLGGRANLERRLATASGVGHTGEDLHVYCLSGTTPARPIENPRQIPAYKYSRRYGPLPPCFSRAAALQVQSREMLLVGGTASVRGEHSVNGSSLDEQLAETCTNLGALVRAWCGAGNQNGCTDSGGLEKFRCLRAYCVDPDHTAAIRSLIESRFGGLEHLEIVQARVCRPELLVEIEGVAEGHGAC